MKLKTLKELRIEEELCEELDSKVYLPVKKELEGIGRTYSLGMRKEDFKGFIEKKFIELREEAIKWIKELEKNSFYEGDEKEIRMVGGLETDRSSQYWVKNWIMHFFNISEEI